MRATDPDGAYALDTFSLTVEDTTNQPPVVQNSVGSQVAKVGQPFQLNLKEYDIEDPNPGDTLVLTASQPGDRSLPGWLHFNATNWVFSGKPSMWDTNTYADRQHTVEVRISDGKASTIISFYVFVEGESFWELFIKAAAPIGTVLSLLAAAYRYYDLLWNTFCGRWYRLPEQYAVVEQEPAYQWLFSECARLQGKKIKKVRVLKDGDVLPDKKLRPKWLLHDTDDGALRGTPPAKTEGAMTVRIYGYDGRILAEFELRIFKDQTALVAYTAALRQPTKAKKGAALGSMFQVFRRRRGDNAGEMGKGLLPLDGGDD